MSFKSFFQFLNRAWRKNKPINKKPPQNRFARPLVEMLERRDLMTVPTILASGVLPVDGSSVSTSTPVIQVQFGIDDQLGADAEQLCAVEFVGQLDPGRSGQLRVARAHQ